MMNTIRGHPHMISDFWVGKQVYKNWISLVYNRLYTMLKSDMGRQVGQKWAQKIGYHIWMAPLAQMKILGQMCLNTNVFNVRINFQYKLLSIPQNLSTHPFVKPSDQAKVILSDNFTLQSQRGHFGSFPTKGMQGHWRQTEMIRQILFKKIAF